MVERAMRKRGSASMLHARPDCEFSDDARAHLVASNVVATTVTALAFVELFPCHFVKRRCSAGGVVERLIVILLGADGDGG